MITIKIKYTTVYKIGWSLCLLSTLNCTLALLICLFADGLFILWPDRFYYPVILFSISHYLYAGELVPDHNLHYIYIPLLVAIILCWSPSSKFRMFALYASLIVLNTVVTRAFGYFLFALSDALLYIRDFKSRFYLDDMLVLTTYYMALTALNK
jgi:hypothetical protein